MADFTYQPTDPTAWCAQLLAQHTPIAAMARLTALGAITRAQIGADPEALADYLRAQTAAGTCPETLSIVDAWAAWALQREGVRQSPAITAWVMRTALPLSLQQLTEPAARMDSLERWQRLAQAVQARSAAMLQTLREQGWRAEGLVVPEGELPLLHQAQDGPTVAALMALGCDPHARDEEGRSCLEYWNERRNASVMTAVRDQYDDAVQAFGRACEERDIKMLERVVPAVQRVHYRRVRRDFLALSNSTDAARTWLRTTSEPFSPTFFGPAAHVGSALWEKHELPSRLRTWALAVLKAAQEQGALTQCDGAGAQVADYLWALLVLANDAGDRAALERPLPNAFDPLATIARLERLAQATAQRLIQDPDPDDDSKARFLRRKRASQVSLLACQALQAWAVPGHAQAIASAAPADRADAIGRLLGVLTTSGTLQEANIYQVQRMLWQSLRAVPDLLGALDASERDPLTQSLTTFTQSLLSYLSYDAANPDCALGVACFFLEGPLDQVQPLLGDPAFAEQLLAALTPEGVSTPVGALLGRESGAHTLGLLSLAVLGACERAGSPVDWSAVAQSLNDTHDRWMDVQLDFDGGDTGPQTQRYRLVRTLREQLGQLLTELALDRTLPAPRPGRGVRL